jgi:ABC-type sugar transport system ATPase subunit
MSVLSIRNVVKRYGAIEVIHNLSFDINAGEFVVFVGPSGCGKSTLLRMIAGLEEFQEGEIAIGDRVVNGLRPWQRDIAMVFQDYALYPHMSVRSNITFSLRMARTDPAQVQKKLEYVSGVLQIGPPARSQAARAVRRPAPARRDGPRDGARPEDLPVRRAAVRISTPSCVSTCAPRSSSCTSGCARRWST